MADLYLKALKSQRRRLWAVMARLKGLPKELPERARIAQIDADIAAHKARAVNLPRPKRPSHNHPHHPRHRLHKILTADQWAQFEADGVSLGAPVDLAHGYIHLSAADQLQGTLDKHFAGQSGLVIAEVDLTALGETVEVGGFTG